ncbi:MAG: hypothetical protein D6696_10775 [Acidobacteria bacterium]|nr:MAG: hypothetical protein D6696_10775 [Acidobacteriota bacterium]
MAIVVARVMWNAERGEVMGVDPDPVKIYWARHDVLEWVIDDDGDDDAAITELRFAGPPATGPFESLQCGPRRRRWIGAGNHKKRGTYKYEVTVEGRAGRHTLDPEVDNEDRPPSP